MKDKPIIVGKVKEFRKSPLSNILYSYKDVLFDKDLWAKSTDFLPKEYDLCNLKTDTNKYLNGWHNGNSWDGLNVKRDTNIEYWQKKVEQLDHDISWRKPAK